MFNTRHRTEFGSLSVRVSLVDDDPLRRHSIDRPKPIDSTAPRPAASHPFPRVNSLAMVLRPIISPIFGEFSSVPFQSVVLVLMPVS